MRKREIGCDKQFLLFSYGTYFSFEIHCKMSSAICLNLDQSKILSSGKELTYSNTMTPFDASGKGAFWKHCGKRRNCLYKQFLLFPQCFLLYHRQKLSFLLHLICRLQMLSIWTKLKFCRLVKSLTVMEVTRFLFLPRMHWKVLTSRAKHESAL